MKFENYVSEVLKTESNDFPKISERLSTKRGIRLNHSFIGIMTEIGELFEMLDKEKLDLVNLMEECSDVMWYVGVAVDELNIDRENFINKAENLNNELTYKDIFLRKIFKRKSVQKILNDSTKYSSQLLDLIKKNVFYGKELDTIKVESILVKIMSEMISLLELANYNKEDSMDINIKKLQLKRFKSGKFTQDEAISRNLVEERKTLEKKD